VFVLVAGLLAETVVLVRMRSGGSAPLPTQQPPTVTPSPSPSPSPTTPRTTPQPTTSDASSFEERFRETLLRHPTAISPLVGRRSTLGGEWGAYDPDATRFLPPNHALVEYNDGHEQGVLVLLIEDPSRPETWKRLYDDADGSLDSDVAP